MYQIFDLNQEEQWQSALSSFPDVDIFYSPAYCRIFQEKGEGRALLFVSGMGDDLAIYPIFLRSVNEPLQIQGRLSETWYDISSPYGYAGPLFSGPDQGSFGASFRKNLNDFCYDQHVVSEFIRFHPLLENHRVPYLNDQELVMAKKVVAVPLGRPEQEIWQHYAYNNRKNINTARRHGLEVVIEENADHLPAFLAIYQETMDRRGAKERNRFSPGFFTALCRELKGNFAFAFVLQEESVLSAELLLFNRRYIHSFLGGTRQSSFSLRPNNLLKHQVILWARERGIRFFLLGGGYKEDDGIFRYKTGFADDGVRDFYLGRRIHQQEAYDLLTELANRETGTPKGDDYFPAYRR